MSAPIQAISITHSEQRSQPTPAHLVYAIQVSLPVRSWTVYRRYSQFLELHRCLSRSASGAPPAPFPPKHAARHTLRAVSGFFSAGASSSTSGSGSGEDDEARQRRVDLERYLRSILSSPDATWRQTSEFAAFIELPPSSAASLKHAAPAATAQLPVVAAQEELPLPKPKYKPGMYAGPSNTSTNSSSGGGFTRTLGISSPSQAQETSTTRALDSTALYSSQQAAMASQDATLGDLAAVLRRQRQMGLAINQELEEQNEILGGLNEEVESVRGKMSGAERQMDRLK